MRTVIVLIGLTLASSAAIAGQSVSHVVTYRPAGAKAAWSIIARSENHFFKDFVSVSIDGKTVVSGLKLGVAAKHNVGQGSYMGKSVTADCELRNTPGTARVWTHCEILVGGERAAVVDF